MDAKTREAVRTRAGNRCEYCRIHQQHFSITFHVEHIVAKQHRGSDDDSNLALACHYCNRHKGPNLTGIDQVTEEITQLFHPRTDDWETHFTIISGRINGQTDVGRMTADLLNMNSHERIRLRNLLEPDFFQA
jgi:5-methylcytosine-specific restriction endonuclease McrA